MFPFRFLFTQQARLGPEEIDLARELEFSGGVFHADFEMKRARVGWARLLEHERLHDLAERAYLEDLGETDLMRAGGRVYESQHEARGRVALVDDPHEILISHRGLV